ncbi:MAG: hypothetical protein KGL39_04715 [Patescibacteria group bacterium]|nr:hypothetical protein [Patescibacteria group bacterium]
MTTNPPTPQTGGEDALREALGRIRRNAVTAIECTKSARTYGDIRRYVQQVIDGIDVCLKLDVPAIEGSVPARETFWLVERNVTPPQYVSHASSGWGSDVWRARRFQTERQAHDYWRSMGEIDRPQFKVVEHMFINKLDEAATIQRPERSEDVVLREALEKIAALAIEKPKPVYDNTMGWDWLTDDTDDIYWTGVAEGKFEAAEIARQALATSPVELGESAPLLVGQKLRAAIIGLLAWEEGKPDFPIRFANLMDAWNEHERATEAQGASDEGKPNIMGDSSVKDHGASCSCHICIGIRRANMEVAARPITPPPASVDAGGDSNEAWIAAIVSAAEQIGHAWQRGILRDKAVAQSRRDVLCRKIAAMFRSRRAPVVDEANIEKITTVLREYFWSEGEWADREDDRKDYINAAEKILTAINGKGA